jgi:hypothetical protein
MAGILKVDKYQDFNGNDIMTSDGSGNVTIDNITTINAAAMKNTPYFEAYLGSNQGISNSTWTKVQFNTEQFDSDNLYDNSTNYRFTPTTAGKYLCYTNVRGGNDGASTLVEVNMKFYKNGSAYQTSTSVTTNFNNNNGANASVTSEQIIDFNGSSDYLEVFFFINTSTGSPDVGQNSVFGAYKLIGA